METIETLVMGAGVVGLAIARTLAEKGREVFVCDKATTAGTGVSARNSGVIHAGIYYPPRSLKAQLCVRGKKLLYDLCAERAVPYRQTGKLVVATTVQESAVLRQIHEQAHSANVHDLVPLTKSEVTALEPALNVTEALLSPSTGIVDVPGLVAALEVLLVEAGGALAFGCGVGAIRPERGGFVVRLRDAKGEDNGEIFTKTLINAAGLGAQAVACAVTGLDEQYTPALRMVRGNYFSLSGTAPFKRLVYPVPAPGGLGVHATLDTAGALRFGPDVEPTQEENYRPDGSREASFREAIARYFPSVTERTLMPDFVGIRPQIGAFGDFNDFKISDEAEHGIPGLVNLFGIESPGVTASLAIAEHVAGLLEGQRKRQKT